MPWWVLNLTNYYFSCVGNITQVTFEISQMFECWTEASTWKLGWWIMGPYEASILRWRIWTYLIVHHLWKIGRLTRHHPKTIHQKIKWTKFIDATAKFSFLFFFPFFRELLIKLRENGKGWINGNQLLNPKSINLVSHILTKKSAI